MIEYQKKNLSEFTELLVKRGKHLGVTNRFYLDNSETKSVTAAVAPCRINNKHSNQLIHFHLITLNEWEELIWKTKQLLEYYGTILCPENHLSSAGGAEWQRANTVFKLHLCFYVSEMFAHT